MTIEMRVVISLIGIVLFWVIIELVKRQKIREDLSPVWLIIGFIISFGAFTDLIIDPIANALRVTYPPFLLLVALFFVIIIVALYFSVVISSLKSQNKELIQKIALIEFELQNYRVNYKNDSKPQREDNPQAGDTKK